MMFECSCPYYGRNEDHCDVGFGYVSPHDVEVIVRHCISRYQDCSRYAELRELGEAEAGRVPDQGPSPTALRDPIPPSPGERLRTTPGIDRKTLTEIHHELRTPLTSIRSFAEILLRYPVDDLDAKRKFLEIIHEEAERLNRTVEEWFGSAERDGLAPLLANAAPDGLRRGNDSHLASGD